MGEMGEGPSFALAGGPALHVLHMVFISILCRFYVYLILFHIILYYVDLSCALLLLISWQLTRVNVA